MILRMLVEMERKQKMQTGQEIENELIESMNVNNRVGIRALYENELQAVYENLPQLFHFHRMKLVERE